MKTIAILIAFALAACSSTPQEYSSLPLDKAQACALKGGRLEHVMGPVKTCIYPTTDAGKLCTDGKQCEGSCDAPHDVKAGTVVSGTCSAEGGHMGCMNVVREGKASGMFCVN